MIVLTATVVLPYLEIYTYLVNISLNQMKESYMHNGFQIKAARK